MSRIDLHVNGASPALDATALPEIDSPPSVLRIKIEEGGELLLKRELEKVVSLELVRPGKVWSSFDKPSEESSARLTQLVTQLEQGHGNGAGAAQIRSLRSIIHQLESGGPGIVDRMQLAQQRLSTGHLINRDVPEPFQMDLALYALDNGYADALCHNLTFLKESVGDILSLVYSKGYREQVLRALPRLTNLPSRLGAHIVSESSDADLFDFSGEKKKGYGDILLVAQNIGHFSEADRESLGDQILSTLVVEEDLAHFFAAVEFLSDGTQGYFEKVYSLLEQTERLRRKSASRVIMSHRHDLGPGAYRGLVLEAVGRSGIPQYLSLSDDELETIGSSTLFRALRKRNDVEELATKLSLFKGLDGDIAYDLATQGFVHQVINSADVFTKIPAEVGLLLVEHGRIRTLLRLFRRIEFSADQATTIMEKVAEGKGIELVLENLSKIPENVLKPLEERFFLAGYKSDIGVPSKTLYTKYRKLQSENRTDEVLALKVEVGRLFKLALSPTSIPESLHNDPIYRSVCNAAYPERRPEEHTSRYAPQFRDHTTRLRRYTFDPQYRIDLSEGVDMVLREGRVPNEHVLGELQTVVDEVTNQMSQVAFDHQKMVRVVEQQVRQYDYTFPKEVETLEQQILHLIVSSRLKQEHPHRLQRLVISYHFAHHRDLKGFLDGTRDHAKQARNQRYAYLLMLREFFFDQLGESSVKIVRAGGKKAGRQLLEQVSELAKKHARGNVDQLRSLWRYPGERFFENIGKQLVNPKRGRDERFRAVAGMIASEQRKLAQLIESTTGEKWDPDDIHLYGHGVFEDVSTEEGRPNIDPKALLTSSALAIFEDQIASIDRELAKYQIAPGQDSQPRVLQAYFSMNHASALARRTTGICVASDLYQWDCDDYFQLLLRDPQANRCEGGCLLHDIKDQGRRLLHVSFQPSSTYLHKVNEAELFDSLLNLLVRFAGKNNFDAIVCSRNERIRTNRTGGEFEIALQRAIRRVRSMIRLSSPYIFSREPNYELTDLDALWVRNRR